ncbi:MAG TPA: hypothetical protein GXX26_13200 [Clostridiaceae bacterium]|nr:hypothetical protein [Clostridiaceae bacterium]
MEKKNAFRWVQPFMFIVLILIVVYSILTMNAVYSKNNDAQPGRIKEAIERACVQCYALEGSYPPDLEYLKDHYGIMLDHDRYYYYYEIFASNVMPVVEVYEKGN